MLLLLKFVCLRRLRHAGKADITGPAADVNLMVIFLWAVQHVELAMHLTCFQIMSLVILDHVSLHLASPLNASFACAGLCCPRAAGSRHPHTPVRASLHHWRPPRREVGGSLYCPNSCECVCIWLHQKRLGLNSSDQRGNAACRKRFVFVNLDACMASQGVTLTVLEQLKVLVLFAHCHMPLNRKCMSSA